MKKLLALLSSIAFFCTPVIGADLSNGDQNLRNVQNLTSDINWYTGLPQAEWEAQREGKLVFWVHMLGNLSGAT
jgi:hypothetical protein